MQAARSYIAVILVWFACGVGSSGATGTEGLPWRVWSISSDSMDYLFMSATARADGMPTLAFNHRSGRTIFLHVGDTLGKWTVLEHQPRTKTELKPSIGGSKSVDADQVILASPSGERRTLAQGKLFPLEGYRAWLVNVQTGVRHDVREGDSVLTGNGVGHVIRIVPAAVEVAIDGESVTLALITEHEVAVLRQRAEESAAAATREQVRLAQVEAQRKVDQALLHPVAMPRRVAKRPQAAPAAQSEYFFGTDGPIPVEYTVLPPLFARSGRLIRSAIVVPTKFESGPVCGFGNGPVPARRLPTVRIAR